MGGTRPKFLLNVSANKTVLELTLESLLKSGVIDGICVVTREVDRTEIERLPTVESASVPFFFARGGRTRQESVWQGLKTVRDSTEFVAVHDAARPLCTHGEIASVVKEAHKSGAAILATPVSSTLKFVNNAAIEKTISREDVWAAQTPQVFSCEVLCRAHELAQETQLVGTDESELVEHLGERVAVVRGSSRNIKLTTPEELELVRAFCR